jgi:hypothetical protein
MIDMQICGQDNQVIEGRLGGKGTPCKIRVLYSVQ